MRVDCASAKPSKCPHPVSSRTPSFPPQPRATLATEPSDSSREPKAAAAAAARGSLVRGTGPRGSPRHGASSGGQAHAGLCVRAPRTGPRGSPRHGASSGGQAHAEESCASGGERREEFDEIRNTPHGTDVSSHGEHFNDHGHRRYK